MEPADTASALKAAVQWPWWKAAAIFMGNMQAVRGAPRVLVTEFSFLPFTGHFPCQDMLCLCRSCMRRPDDTAVHMWQCAVNGIYSGTLQAFALTVSSLTPAES